MLASDSDSDFEYPADGNNSEASDDCVLLGKLALGVDPTDLKVYDGRSTPVNGSQYLMKVMAEKKVVPKVVSFDTSKLEGKRKGGEAPHYLDRFMQVCGSGDEVAHVELSSSSFLPSREWREETTSCFSMLRNKVERWQYKLEGREIRISDPVTFPTSNDNTHWLKFCFGESFAKLAVTQKPKTKEEKLSDFFLDLYDPNVTAMIMQRTREEAQVTETDNQGIKSEAEETERNETAADETLSVEDKHEVLGNRPLLRLVLRLNQNQLENLVKWNLLWVQNLGFVNECQGQWLYAILACLFKPVDPSVMSDLRSITRILIRTRNRFYDEWGLYTAGWDVSVNPNVFDFINTLNLFIYVIADYFQQKDLVTVL